MLFYFLWVQVIYLFSIPLQPLPKPFLRVSLGSQATVLISKIAVTEALHRHQRLAKCIQYSGLYFLAYKTHWGYEILDYMKKKLGKN